MADNNVILTHSVYSKLFLFDLGRRLKFARNMSSALTKEFANKSQKIGNFVDVHKPYRFVGGNGLAWDPEAIVDQVCRVQVTDVPHVHWAWDSIGKTLSLREAMKLYVTPATIAMASRINAGAATWAANNAMNSVGTPGTPPTGVLTYLNAGDRLVELGLPDEEELKLIINRKLSSAYVNGTQTLFNPAGAISNQYRKGEMQDALGYDIMLDQTINQHVNGVFGGTPLANSTGTTQQGEGGNNATMSFITDGWTSGGTALKLGDKFVIGSAASATVGGVESVHPQTRITTGVQQVFTVQADISDTTGAITMVVYPAATPSGQYQNVNGAIVDNAIITMIGTSGGTATQGVLMHENAFAFVSVPIHEPEEGMGAKVVQWTDPDTKLTISHIKYYDGDTGEERHKLQALTGYGNLYREMACVVQG